MLLRLLSHHELSFVREIDSIRLNRWQRGDQMGSVLMVNKEEVGVRILADLREHRPVCPCSECAVPRYSNGLVESDFNKLIEGVCSCRRNPLEPVA